MGPLLVVLLHPLCTDLPHLIQRLEYIGIEHFVSIGPIEPFDEGILIRLARLNISERDPTVDAPARKAVGQELGPVIQSNRLGLTTPGRHLVQHPQDTCRGQGRVHFKG